jgi:hypothetical protein
MISPTTLATRTRLGNDSDGGRASTSRPTPRPTSSEHSTASTRRSMPGASPVNEPSQLVKRSSTSWLDQ